jgi:hypothetical protein
MTDDPFRDQANRQTPQTNPALGDLSVLLGKWQIEMRFPTDPVTTVHAQSLFSWLENGAFLKIHSLIETEDNPWSTIIVSRDEKVETYHMLYYDWRGTSRMYQMSLENGQWKQWRDEPGFFQRFRGTLSPDGKTITAYWEISSDGEHWELDFDLFYTKIS